MSPESKVWERAEHVLPRGVSSGHRVGFEQVIVRGEGAYLWDANGRRHVDYLLAWGPIILGHCDPRVNAAVSRAMATCDLTGIGPQVAEVEAAEMVVRLMPSAEKVIFCTSGSDATLHAVHIARLATGRPKIVKFHGMYHGWHDQLAVGSLRADTTTSTPMNTPNGGGLHPGSVSDVIVVEWNDFDAVRAVFDGQGDTVAAIICEPYAHSFGCVPPASGFLEELQALAAASGAALIFDEIKTGFRADLGGYQKVAGVIPDMTAFGKAVANGFSVAGLAGSDELMGYAGAYAGDRATIDGTYNAAPHGMAAVVQTLTIMEEEGVIEATHAMAGRLRGGLSDAIKESGVAAVVAGFGSEWCLYFRDDAPRSFREALDVDLDRQRAYQRGMFERGFLEPAAPIGDKRLCAATTNEDIDRTVEAATQVLAEIAAQS